MLRFTIRDVFWLTLVVGMALGWWLWWRSIPHESRVSGAITVAGKPLGEGRICFYSADAQISGAVVTNGQFQIQRITAGPFRVAIEGEGVASRYADLNSGLSAEIRGGANQINFDLR